MALFPGTHWLLLLTTLLAATSILLSYCCSTTTLYYSSVGCCSALFPILLETTTGTSWLLATLLAASYSPTTTNWLSKLPNFDLQGSSNHVAAVNCFLANFLILYVWEAAAACFYTFSSLCLLSCCCFFLPNLPSPLMSFILPMMKLSKSIHYMEYELMIKNL